MGSARKIVYGELKRRLMSGAFLPGQRLREEHIAREMGVSRSPVRSAIQQLAEDGLVRLEERRGAVVIGWTDRDIDEAFEVRSLMESYAAGVAATNASHAEVDELDAVNLRMREMIQSDRDDRIAHVQQLNNEFHHLLADATHSARIRAVLENFIDMPIIIGAFYFYSEREMLASVEHHQNIITGLRAKSKEMAQAAMQLHLASTRVLFQRQRTRA